MRCTTCLVTMRLRGAYDTPAQSVLPHLPRLDRRRRLQTVLPRMLVTGGAHSHRPLLSTKGIPVPRRSNLATVNAAATEATASRYRNLPRLPTWQELTAALREANRCQDGPDTVWLYCHGAGWPDAAWSVGAHRHDWPAADHAEEVPGDGKPFDAAAAARRLLSEARLAGFR